MSLFLRVFGASADVPAPALIRSCLLAAGIEASSQFAEDGSGWYRGEITMADGELVLERWLADEDGIRAELNAWAGVVETLAQEHAGLMERIIQTQQLITLSVPGDRVSACAELLCQHLARVTRGFYQVDGRGFVGSNGTLLVRWEE